MSKGPSGVNGLGELLSRSESAKSYFLSLPDYVQGMLQQRSDSVHTEQELRRSAETLLADGV